MLTMLAEAGQPTLYQLLRRLRSDELEKAWWNEQAELSSGPAATGKGAIPEEEAASTQWQVGHLAVC